MTRPSSRPSPFYPPSTTSGFEAATKIFNEIVNPSTSLRSLTIEHRDNALPAFLPLIFAALSSVAPGLVRLTCKPTGGAHPYEAYDEEQEEVADMLELLGRMKDLKPLTITLLDPASAFFVTLRALPVLATVHIFVASPAPAAKIATALAKASFRRLEISTSEKSAWKKGALKKVLTAANAAGLGFRTIEVEEVQAQDDP